MDHRFVQHVRSRRLARGWTQAQLAALSGVSRTAVSAIESDRMAPSVAAAMSLARALECSVEELFGAIDEPRVPPVRWAWKPPRLPWRYWQAEVGGNILCFPIESADTNIGSPHDGNSVGGAFPDQPSHLARQTLILATCDPAVGLLATLYQRETGFRLITIDRSSQQAIDLLAQNLVHVAALHLSSSGDDRNGEAVRINLGDGYMLLRTATWQEGLAVARGKAAASIRSVLQSRLRWIGRESGSGARQCLDQLLPRRTFRYIARNHRGVAEAIRCGWADAGICHRLACEEAGLKFHSVRHEAFEFCFSSHTQRDPRVQALIRVVRSAGYRRLLGELPGYDTRRTGEIRDIS